MMKKLLCTILALVLMLSVFPTAFAQNQYAYSLDQLCLTDLKGNAVTNPQGSCMASVRMAKTDYSRMAVDTLIICAYSTTGELIEFNLMQSYLNPGEFRQFASYINVPKGQLIGEVRAFVWESLDSMVPVSEVVSLITNNGPATPIREIYTANGYLTDTNRTNYATPKNLARFTVESSDNFDGQRIDSTFPLSIWCDIGTSDLIQYPGMHVTAEIEKTADDTYKLVSYTPDSRQAIVDTTLSLFDDDDYSMFSGSTYVANPYVRFYETADATKSTKYPLNRTLAEMTMYVNGTYVSMNASNFNKFVVNNKSGDIRLVDKYNSDYGIADGLYDSIYVTYYATAMVDTVSTATGKVSFSKASAGMGSSVMLDAEDLDLVFHIYLNGIEIPLSELKKGDVLSIAYSAGNGFQNSTFYDVYVSRNTAKGQYTSYNTRNETFKIGGVDYKFTEGSFALNLACLTMGDSYILYLDVFGRIFDFDTDASGTKYAVFDKFTKSSADDFYRATLFLPDGTTVAYEIDTTRVTVDGYTGASLNSYLLTKLYNDTNNNWAIEDAEKTTTNKVAVQNRVVVYKVNSANKITGMSFVTGRPGAGTVGSPAAATYSEKTQTIGSVRFGNATKIIDAMAYLDEDNQTSYLKPTEINTFIHDEEYTAFAYGSKFNDGSYPFVIITSGPYVAAPEPPESELISGYALFDKFTKSSADDYFKATLFLPDGTTQAYEIDTTRAEVDGYTGASLNGYLLTKLYNDTNCNSAIDDAEKTTTNKVAIQNRVVEYSVNASNRIVSLSFASGTPGAGTMDVPTTAAYSKSTQTVGAIQLSDATRMIDAIAYRIEDNQISYLKSAEISTLLNDVEYTAFAYGDRFNDGSYPLVLITSGPYVAEPEPPESELVSGYALFDKFTKSSADDYYKATLFLPDGTTQAYEVDTTRIMVDGYTGASLNGYLLTKLYNDTNCNSAIDDAEKTTTNKVAVQNRVVEYKVNASNKIVSLSFASGTPGAGTMNAPLPVAYSKSTQTVGAIQLGETTKIIDAITYLDENNLTSYLKMAEISAFVDEVEYTAFAYGDKFSDGTYPLVLVTAGDGAYTKNTRFAVVVDTPGRGDINGESIYSIDVIYGGDEITLTTVDDADLEINGYASAVNLAKGDVIVFQGDTNEVKQIDVLFKASYAVGDYMADTIASLLVVGNNASAITIPSDIGSVTIGGTLYRKWTTDWNPRIHEQDVQLVSGPIIEKKAGYFTIGKIANGYVPGTNYTGWYTNIDNDETSTDGVLEINFSDDTKVAVYDYYQSERARLTVGTTSDIMASVIGDVYMIGYDENCIAWDNAATADSTINFAFAKVVDGIATDVFVIRAK